MTPPSSPAPRAPLPVCEYCGKPLTDLFDAFLVLMDATTHGYPREPEDVVGVYTHANCGPDGGYNIDFPRLLSHGVGDEPQSWYGHLIHKTWFPPEAADILDDAYLAAKEVRAYMNPPMRSVIASIPQRPPRTPENPRNIRPAMRARVLERDNFRCRRCGCGPNDSPLVVDHIQPVAKGGTGAFDNLQTLCRMCNAGKSDAEPHPHDLGASA